MGTSARPVRFDVAGLSLSGIENSVVAPRALVLALHGGGYTAGYWDHPLDPGASLLSLGAILGYHVVAIDRPGYGSSRNGRGFAMDAQADMLYELVQKIRPTQETPVFLIGHSAGGILALIMASRPEATRLSGIDVSGVPLRWTSDQLEHVARLQVGTEGYAPRAPRELRVALFYADGDYDPAILDHDDRLAHPIPTAELGDIQTWPDRMAEICKRIRIPVQYVQGDREASSAAGAEIIEEAAYMLSGSSRAVFYRHSRTGHNISLHAVARAYHLRAFAFFDECS